MALCNYLHTDILLWLTSEHQIVEGAASIGWVIVTLHSAHHYLGIGMLVESTVLYGMIMEEV